MITVPINDPVRVYRRLKPEIDARIEQVLSSGRWIGGRFVDQFAADFAGWCGVKCCVPLANGTDALELSLRALGVGPGDEVVTVANAGGFATEACRLVGATPVWVDVRPDTLSLDPSLIPEVVGNRTKVIVATHLFGIVADVIGIRRELNRIERNDVRILEDCAQAHGATLVGRRVGSLGEIAAFSFYPTKNLGALGDAGAIVTDDCELAERVTWLGFHGWRERFRSALPFSRNSRMSEIQAAVLCVKLKHLDDLNAERRQIIARYALATQRPCSIVGADDATNVGHLAILRSPARAAVALAMSTAGIASDVHYPILDCDQESAQGMPGRKSPLPVSERARDQILTLPCYPGLTQQELETIARVLSTV